MDLNKLTEQDIKKMSYNELIGLVRETNRIPGGAQTIAYIASMCCLREGKRVLDIGTSTGNTAIDIASLSGAEVIGIDINENSLAEAQKRAEIVGVDSKITFELNDAMNLSLPDNFFDVVICGNVTSLLSDKDKALSEYKRVLRNTGFLVAVPMYYIKKPSDQLIQDVSDAIQVNIKPLYKDFWINFFTKGDFEIFLEKDFAFDVLDEEKINHFCDSILSREHLKDLNENAASALKEVYRKYMLLFRYNLSHMGYTILILRKSHKEIDSELFTAHAL
ncbi:MAG: hypothetical protein BHW64_05495 [Candidatus Melainabacteria bacterium LEY3_CP_29_8]|nr:MAG: hypothetical protein BHW64_05495 [Candidatus Melainabacteria bacterium LEY3_CP_29_8]